MKIYFVVLIMLLASQAIADTCQDWFNGLNLKKDSMCLSKCESAMVGMDTFMCHDRCDEFCKNIPIKVLGTVAYYPGLNSTERKLIARYPVEAIKVYFAKRDAENATERMFGSDGVDDETDAFRHFMWAGLIDKEIGPKLARQFLDAHEANDGKSASSVMDLNNNAEGLAAVDKMIKEQNFSADNLVKEAIKELRDGILTVIRPRGLLK